MKINTYSDVLRASVESGVPSILIAEAFEVETPLRAKLAHALVNEERWIIFEEIHVICSVFRSEVLEQILEHTTTNDERWRVWSSAIPGSKLATQAFLAIQKSYGLPDFVTAKKHSYPIEYHFDTRVVKDAVRSIIENL